MTPQTPSDSTLHLPRILCLHGGGTNARIFHLQCRILSKHLSPHFYLIYASAPFPSSPGPNVASVYASHGPFKRWLRWLPSHPLISAEDSVAAIDESIEKAIREDDEKGVTGDVVAVLGFSQGAKVVGSLLLRQQVRKEKGLASKTNFRFGVLIAGRGPLVSLDPEVVMNEALVDASEIGWERSPEELALLGTREHVLKMPTIHVHGLRDGDLEFHRRLMGDYCERRSAKIVEWDGGHRLPIKRGDVEAVVWEILEVASETGVLVGGLVGDEN